MEVTKDENSWCCKRERERESSNLKNAKGVTLIALVITIIVLLILAGVVLNTVLGNDGIIAKAQLAKEKNNYKSAKEIVEMKLLEIQTDCVDEKKEYNIEEIAIKLKEDGEILIEKYFNEETAKVKEGIGEKPAKLKGIVVSVDSYENYKKYKFLIGKSGKIEKIIEGEITETTKEEDFKNIQEYEKEVYGEKIDVNTENEENVSNEIEEEDSEVTKYKKQIAKQLTELGVKTSYKQPVEDYISNIQILADKNYREGTESNIVKLKTDLTSRYAQSLSLKNIEGYENFDAEDFILGNKNMLWVNVSDGADIPNMKITYDKTTGTLNLGMLKSYVQKTRWTFYNRFDLYAIKRNVIEMQGKNSGSIGENEDLEYFKTKLSEAIKEYGIEDIEENSIKEKTAEEMANIIKQIARDKFEEGVSTYKVLVQGNLSSRYEQTVSATQIDGYQNLTIDNFFIQNKRIDYEQRCDAEEASEMTKTYDQNAGTLKFGKQKSWAYDWTIWNVYDVYLLKKQIINLEDRVQ